MTSRPERDLADHLLVLWSRRYLFVLAVVGAAVAALAISLMLPKSYRSTATLVISDAKMPPLVSGEPRPDSRLYSDTYAALLKNQAVAAQVVRELDLERQLNVRPDTLVRLLSVRPVPNTLLITVSLDFRDADWAAKLVNAQTSKAVELSRTMATTDLTDTRSYLEQQVVAARQELADREEQLQAVKAEARFEEATKQLESLLRLRGELQQNLSAAEQHVAQSTAIADSIQKALATQDKVLTLTRSVVDDPVLKEVAGAGRPRSAQELLGLKMAGQIINPLHERSEPELVRASAEAAGAAGRRDLVRKQLATNEAQVRRLERDLAQTSTRLMAAQREYDLAKKSYESFTQSYENARLSVRAQAAELKLLSPATPVRHPVGPRVALNVAIATVTSIILGIFLVLFVDYLRGARAQAPVALEPRSVGEPTVGLRSSR